jgi:hypothetical protein
MTITKKKFQWGNKPTPKTVLDLYDRYLPQIEEGNVIVAVEHHLSEKEYAEFESKYVPCVIERRGDDLYAVPVYSGPYPISEKAKKHLRKMMKAVGIYRVTSCYFIQTN